MFFVKKIAESAESTTYEMDVFLIATLAVVGAVSVIAIIFISLLPYWWALLVVSGLIFAFFVLIIFIIIDVYPLYRQMISGTLSQASDVRPGIKQVVLKKFSDDTKRQLKKNPR
ncbi:MAG: hypothetical protein PHV17_05675 [Candidatus Omnitrophica bacterium]|nr:hypothetical protein [Candidatus Omnitrophota bacterium]